MTNWKLEELYAIKPEYGGLKKPFKFDNDKMYKLIHRCGKGKLTISGRHLNQHVPLRCANCNSMYGDFAWREDKASA